MDIPTDHAPVAAQSACHHSGANDVATYRHGAAHGHAGERA